ncbi:unnamed protein product [Closterium sp. Naga37s-1]|nr:unnamed protein product [Closterium sp. Naga37s-1]
MLVCGAADALNTRPPVVPTSPLALDFRGCSRCPLTRTCLPQNASRCCDGGDSAGSDGAAGGASDWAGVLTARKLLNPTQVITRIAPLLSRSSFPLPPTAEAAAAAAVTVTTTAGTVTAMPSDSPSPPSSHAAAALDSVDPFEARCLALRLIGCLAPLAADVAHVQELVGRAAMEAEGQQECSVLSVLCMPCMRLTIPSPSLAVPRPSHTSLPCSAVSSFPSLPQPAPRTFLCCHLAPCCPAPFIPIALLPLCSTHLSLPSLSPSFPSFPPLFLSPPHAPPQQRHAALFASHLPLLLRSNRHAALFALTFLCDVSPPFALHTLPRLLSLALPASPPPPLPLCLKRHLHRSSQLPLPQQAKQPGVRGNAHMSQAKADEHVGQKRQQQQSDDSPAAHAPLHLHSLTHSLPPPHTLPPLALHTPLLSSSSHMPRVCSPLDWWRGGEEEEEGVRMRMAAVVVKCLAGHEEKAVRRMAWQVAIHLLSAFPCAPWSPLLRSWVCALQAQLG